MAEGVEERRSKRRPPGNGADRASATRGYPARKGADFRHGLDGWEALDRLGLLETLDGANRTDRRARTDGVVGDRLDRGGSHREAIAGSDLPCRGGWEWTAGEEPAEAPGPLHIRETACSPQGRPAERRPQYPRRRRRGVQDAREPDEVDRGSEGPSHDWGSDGQLAIFAFVLWPRVDAWLGC